jgi:predicted lysophospholipase L1 biosynthesis ABC-type transport system permease subunit
MARRYWPGEDPIGRRLKWGDASSTAPWLTIVGIVGDVKQGALDQPTMAHTYEPFAQECQGPSNPICAARFFLVRTQVPPESLVPSIRETVRQIDPAQPLGRTVALADLVDQSLAPRKFSTMLLGLFASGALLLAAIGVYGVMAYSVSQRTREIGTRLALGAAPATVLWLILRRGGRLALVGLAIGVVASFGLTRLLTGLLFDVGPSDPITFASGAAVLAVVALAACLIPARRAMRVSPLTATTAD